jgi:hypothetical protein
MKWNQFLLDMIFNQSVIIKQLLVPNRSVQPKKKVDYDFNLVAKIIVYSYF